MLKVEKINNKAEGRDCINCQRPIPDFTVDINGYNFVFCDDCIMKLLYILGNR